MDIQERKNMTPKSVLAFVVDVLRSTLKIVIVVAAVAVASMIFTLFVWAIAARLGLAA